MFIYNNAQQHQGHQESMQVGTSYEHYLLAPAQSRLSHTTSLDYHSERWRELRSELSLAYQGRYAGPADGMPNITHTQGTDHMGLFTEHQAHHSSRIQYAGSERGQVYPHTAQPHRRRLLMPRSNVDPDIRESTASLIESCKLAEKEFKTWEPGPELTDKLLQPISRPAASKGPGSRRGLEAYQCLWLSCGRRISKKANAISHLLSHLPYKPFLCDQW